MHRAVRLTVQIALALTGPALAGPAAEIEWQVEAGFGGHYAADRWTPLRVTVHNRGESRGGRIIVPVKRDEYYGEPVLYSVPVDLPRGARKSYRLVIPRVEHRAQVKLIAGGETLVTRLERAPHAPGDVLMVVLSSGEGILGFLHGTPAPVSGGPTSPGWRGGGIPVELAIAQTQWGALPETWLGWDAVGAVVVAGAELGDARSRELEALRLWVRLGGTLIATGGARAPALAAGPLGELLPLKVTGTRAVDDLAELERWGEEPIARRAALIADGDLCEGAEVLLGSAAEPLVVSGPVGAGSVVMTTFDFTAEPVRYWDGQERMWRRLVGEGASRARGSTDFLSTATAVPSYMMPGGSAPVAAAAGQTREASLPPLWLVAGFLVAYIVVLVPLNYWFVSRLGRRELAWLTTPAIILVFFCAAYGTGFALRGHRTLLNRVAVIEVEPGQSIARAVGFVGIFSPAKMDYSLRLRDTAAAALSTAGTSAGRFTVEFGPEPKVRDIAVNMWSTRVIEVPFVAELGGDLAGHFEWDGTVLHAVVRNNTRLPLESVGIVHEGRIGRTIALAPGGEGRVDTGNPVKLSQGEEADLTLGEHALARLFGDDPYRYAPPPAGLSLREPWLVAVHTGPLMPVDLLGRNARTEDASVIVTRLPVRLKAMKGALIPSWMISTRVIAAGTAGGGAVRQWEQGGTQATEISGGASVTWEFDVPEGPNGVEAVGLQVEMYTGGTPRNPDMEAYSFRSGQWRAVTVRTGSNVTLAPAEAYMSSDGRVRIRVSSSGSARISNLGLRARVNGF